MIDNLPDKLRGVTGLTTFAELFGFDWSDEDWVWSDVANKMATEVEEYASAQERTCHDTREFGDFTCSVCGCVVWDTFNENPTISKNGRYAELNYCPHCGARIV